MPTAAFANLGCKVNQYETDKMIESFAERGFEIAGFDQPADIYVINSCSVTGAADRKSRHMARRASRQKEGARVVVTGCFAQLAIDTGEVVDGAALLVPNREKMRVAELALDAFPELGVGSDGQARASVELLDRARPIAVFPEQAQPGGLISIDGFTRSAAPLPMRHTHTRDTLKVQDGCRHFCAFCSIPYTRDTMASRGLDAVIAEAREMAGRGTREVVVTGVCVGAYRDEASGAGLPELMAAVASVPGLERVRLSSLQPIETDEALIGVLARYPRRLPAFASVAAIRRRHRLEANAAPLRYVVLPGAGLAFAGSGAGNRDHDGYYRRLPWRDPRFVRKHPALRRGDRLRPYPRFFATPPESAPMPSGSSKTTSRPRKKSGGTKNCPKSAAIRSPTSPRN